MGKLFDLEASGYFYTRLQNPTNDHVAAKIAAMEGGTAAMLTSSGQAATFFAMFNICEAGDHFVCSSTIYGGTFNLFGVTMKKLGIDVTFVDADASDLRNVVLNIQQGHAGDINIGKFLEGTRGMSPRELIDYVAKCPPQWKRVDLWKIGCFGPPSGLPPIFSQRKKARFSPSQNSANAATGPRVTGATISPSDNLRVR